MTLPPPNLVEAWLAVELAVPGRTLSDACREIGEATGRSVNHSLLSRWRCGTQAPPGAFLEV